MSSFQTPGNIIPHREKLGKARPRDYNKFSEKVIRSFFRGNYNNQAQAESRGEETLKVKARFFALYREAVGRREIELELEEDATVASLIEKLRQEFAGFPHSPVLVAVNTDYAEPEHKLRHGDEVAFLPPLSGG